MKSNIPDFILHKFSTKIFSGVFEAQVIFVDISGFTHLTETLMIHGAEGAEILSDILSRIFNPLVEIVCNNGGTIPHFAGDAFTAIFEDINSEKIIKICEKIKDTTNKNNKFYTRFGTFIIQIHCGISYGKITWGITGEALKSFYFRGEAIENAATALNKANSGEFIFDKYFYEVSTNREQLTQIHEKDFFKCLDSTHNYNTKNFTDNFTPRDNSGFSDDYLCDNAVVNSFSSDQNTAQVFSGKIYADRDLTERLFYPTTVTEYKGIGEFRDVVSIFIIFSGSDDFDFMNRFTSLVRDQFENFGGYLKEFDFSDKGDLAVGFFGAPVTFENNVTRALECITAIKQVVQIEFPSQNLRIGITRGISFAGKVGGTQRYQYALVGSRVNLAARLAITALPGEIITDEMIAQSPHFEFESNGAGFYKGFSKEIPTFRFIRKKISEHRRWAIDGNINLEGIKQRSSSNLMIGRDAELEALKLFVKNKFNTGKNGWVYIWGEAGIGKSRLVYELQRLISDLEFSNNSFPTLLKDKLLWAHCACDEILRKPFNPIIRFLKNYFRQSLESTAEQNLRDFEFSFESLIRQLPEQAHLEGAELIRTKSILSALLGIYYPNTLWQQLDAKGRYDNTLTSLVDFFSSLSFIQPVVLEIEDAHWLDEASTDFLKLFSKKIINKPVIVIQSCRYDDEGSKAAISYQPSVVSPQNIENISQSQTKLKADSLKLIADTTIEIDLNVWQPDTLSDFATARLGDKVHPELTETLWRTTNGNPFYAEQVLDYFQENSLLSHSDDGWIITDKNIKISNSIQAVLTARIDRLSVILKETVKAAAVIGREFEVPILSEVLSHQEEYIERNGNKNEVLREQIEIAEKGQIWRAMSELRYIFKHTLLREAAYDMQLRTRLRELHFAIARSIEKIYADALPERYIDIAFHYEQAEVLPKMREYLGKAAEYARYNFQNQQALEFYDRLLKHETDNNERIKILIRKGQVLQLIGRWHESEICFHEALFKSTLLGDIILKGKTNSALGVLLMLKGEYDKSRSFLEKSANYFERINDIKDILNIYGHLGNLFFRQGDYSNAENYFSRCLKLSDEVDEMTPPLIVSNLGLTYMNQGFYEKGIACQSEALKKCEAAKDKIGQAILNVNIGIVFSEKGDIESALPFFENGLALAEFLGNKQLTSIALGCLGNIWRLKNDFTKSLAFLEKDERMCTELGDKQGLSIVHELLGRYYLSQGNAKKSLIEFETSLTMCRQLNYRKGIAKALLGMGEAQTQLEQFEPALAAFHAACDEADAINNQLIKGNTLIAKGILFRKFGRTDLYAHLLGLLKPIVEKLGNEPLMRQMNDFEESLIG